tara:strand:+ start:358 stop:747 length:390 start_codon:yes stop_codon:yes gene_type:complete
MSIPRTLENTIVEPVQERHINLSDLIHTPNLHTPTILAQINNTEIEKLKDVIDIERAVLDNENKWSSCCFTVDKRAVVFFSQLLITLSVVILCIYQLVKHHDNCDSNQLYSGILSMVIGIYLPQPKIKK